jgi:predicted AAA+ superfamily ATPase
MGPMTFGEYLRVRSPYLFEKFSCFDFKTGMTQSVHEKLNRHFFDFLFVGGMPESVLAFHESRDFFESQQIQDSILDTYKDDFNKYSPQNDRVLMHHLFEQLPHHVGARVTFSHFSREHPSKVIKDGLSLFEQAKLCYMVKYTHGNGLPMAGEMETRKMKPLFLDHGLMSRMQKATPGQWENMEQINFINKGVMAEQFVGQHLLYIDGPTVAPQVFAWQREGRSDNAEVDFLVDHNSKIIPIEVKAGKSGSLKSLHQFCSIKNASLALRFDMNTPSHQVISPKVITAKGKAEVNIRFMSLPLYLTERCKELLAESELPQSNL